MNIAKKFRTLVKTIRIYKSWPLMVRSSLPGFRMKGPTVCRLRCGVSYEVESWSDLHVIREVWTHGHYDRFVGMIGEGATVIDVGAHIGVFAIKAAARAPKGRVFAFEPLPDNIARLKKNILRNGLSDRITVVESAVSGANGTRDLYVMPERFSPSLYPLKDNQGKVSITCTTLHDAFDAYKIERCDFLKIDCEGPELEILAATAPEYFKRIRSITIETHDHLISENAGNAEKIEALLKGSRFEVSPSNDGTHMLFARNTLL